MSMVKVSTEDVMSVMRETFVADVEYSATEAEDTAIYILEELDLGVSEEGFDKLYKGVFELFNHNTLDEMKLKELVESIQFY